MGARGVLNCCRAFVGRLGAWLGWVRRDEGNTICIGAEVQARVPFSAAFFTEVLLDLSTYEWRVLGCLFCISKDTIGAVLDRIVRAFAFFRERRFTKVFAIPTPSNERQSRTTVLRYSVRSACTPSPREASLGVKKVAQWLGWCEVVAKFGTPLPRWFVCVCVRSVHTIWCDASALWCPFFVAKVGSYERIFVALLRR